MTPNEIKEHRAFLSRLEGRSHLTITSKYLAGIATALLDHIDRLNTELAEARLTAEEAWDAHDEKENA